MTNRFYGIVGFASEVEKSPGIWKTDIVEKNYFGNLERVSYANRGSSSTINDDIVLQNVISLVSDPFLEENLYQIKYITWKGSKWKIASVEIAHPRVKLNLGGLYVHQS